MATSSPVKPRVFVDADMLFAGAASPSEQGASLVVLRMAEITLIEAITSEQVITEVVSFPYFPFSLLSPTTPLQ